MKQTVKIGGKERNQIFPAPPRAKEKPPQCSYCHSPSEFQCDEIIEGRQCTVFMCVKHNTTVEGHDFCRDHRT